MGFKTGEFPPVEPTTFLQQPLMDRMKTLALHWCEHGFGTPKMVHTVYLVKLTFFYLVLGLVLATTTSDLPAFWHVSQWWDQPVVYQKAVIWTMLLEAIGVAGSWGPLAGKFKPMTGGIRYWAKPGTIRLRPWKAVPGTAGNTRTVGDVVLYLGFLLSLFVALVAQPVDGLVRPALLVAPIVLIVLTGLRDKVIFLAARSEQYLPALIFFAALDLVDMIVALKLLICVVWIGAGISKFGKHFTNVVAPMVSNSPCIGSRRFRRAQYRNFPENILPSKAASTLAHAGGTLVEIATPMLLLFSTNRTVTALAVSVMVIFHVFIISTFPLAVPLEWNVLFAYATVFLFWGHPAWDGFAVGDMSSPVLTLGIVAGLVFFPILGNLRPDLVSFLPSMRQYAGNWASALWAFAPGAEDKLNALDRSSGNQVDQLQVALPCTPEIAEITMQQTIAWRSMHSQGRGLFSLLMRHVPELDRSTVREAEFACNSIMGFNFGDGHFHNEDMIEALQERCHFEPGEFIVAWVESQPIHKPTQTYKVIDAAIGVIERGTWNVADAVREQPWLPNGPIPMNVTWTRSPRPATADLPTPPEPVGPLATAT